MKDVDDLSSIGVGDVRGDNWLSFFTQVERSISRYADQQLNLLFGMSFAEVNAVACLANRPDMTQVQLAFRLKYDLGALSRLISRLVEAGIAKRVRHIHDRRCWCISLTAHGASLGEDIAGALKAIDGRFTSSMTDQQEHDLVVLLKRLLVNAGSEPVD